MPRPPRVRALPVHLPPLTDRIEKGVRVLLVGINPGIRSSVTGHHFAGYSNRFWKLLFDAGLVPEPVTFEDDDRLPQWGFGITNLVPRPTPGIGDLKPAEYAAGHAALVRKIRRYRPVIVALVGVTLFRSLAGTTEPPADPRGAVPLGDQQVTLGGARVFVLPNPSGRNANYTYAEMLAAFRALRRYMTGPPAPASSDGARKPPSKMKSVTGRR